jgi:hypothetical protein
MKWLSVLVGTGEVLNHAMAFIKSPAYPRDVSNDGYSHSTPKVQADNG